MALFNRDEVNQYVVDSVDDPLEVNGCRVKRIRIRVPRGAESRSVDLRDDWAEYTTVRPGDTITTIGYFSRQDASQGAIWNLDVTFHANAVIVRPEVLVPVTSISGSFLCLRRTVLSRQLRSNLASEGMQQPSLSSTQYGTLLHAIIQKCFASVPSGNDTSWDHASVHMHAQDVVSEKQGIDAAFRAGLSQQELLTLLQKKLEHLVEFGNRFVCDEPKVNAVVDEEAGIKTILAITGVDAIEKEVRSSLLGIRGQVDIVARVTLVTVVDGISSMFGRFVMPLEIKTGKAHDPPRTEHVGQALLYAIALNGLEDHNIGLALLYYSASSSLTVHRVFRNELRGLLQTRNSVAEWMTPRDPMANEQTTLGLALPTPLDDPVHCGLCFQADNCMLYRTGEVNKVEVPPDMEDLFKSKSRHMDNKRTIFFFVWDRLLDAEDKYSRSSGATEWDLASSTDSSYHEDIQGREDAHVLLAFTRRRSGQSKQHTRHGLYVGDDVLVRADGAPDLDSRGLVYAVSPESVVLRIGRNGDVPAIPHHANFLEHPDGTTFRITSNMRGFVVSCARRNLAGLLGATSRFTRRRDIVINLEPPEFDPILPGTTADTSFLDESQRSALHLILTARDYAIIRGPPGSGKTTLIVALLKALVAKGKSVLLTSHTHSALDSILIKMRETTVSIIRLGPMQRVHPDARVFCPPDGDSSYTLGDLTDRYMRVPIIATTCLSIDHVLFTRRRFDYCVVDEAAQILLPICLGPISFADRFVLVGDENQLQPLLLSDTARQSNEQMSLFHRLVTAHPRANAELSRQYRMSSDIMLLSNHMTYGGRVMCGSDEIARSQLDHPRLWLRSTLHSDYPCGQCWMETVLQPHNGVVFLDTDSVPAGESSQDGLVHNEIEALIVAQIVNVSILCGITPGRISVISPYHRQLVLIKRNIGHHVDVELLTIDQSQGRENEFYLVSLVRSNELREVGSLIQDPKRMNVAFTRARSKLVIVGSRRTLESSQYMRELLSLMDTRGWIHPLPPDAHQCYSGSV